MSVDLVLRALAEEIESKQPWPRPQCPACGSGHIRFGDPDAAEDYTSASARDDPGFGADWIHGTFLIRGQCENPNCRQMVHGAGSYRVDYARDSVPIDIYGQSEPPYSRYYRVVHLHPAIMLMTVPKSAPEEVHEGVLRASRVVFVDPGLAATALRATVERFLTLEGVPSVGCRGHFLGAQRRIETWRYAGAGRGPVADLLLAVKWIGDVGTHDDSRLSTVDVLEGASLLDEAFHRHYTGPDIDVRARSINAAKGPSRPSSTN